MKKVLAFVLALVTTLPMLYAETKDYQVVFDTSSYAPYLLSFGFLPEQNINSSFDGTDPHVEFSDPNPDGEVFSSFTIFGWYRIISEDRIDLKLDIEPLKSESGQTIDWTLSWTSDGSGKEISSKGNPASGSFHNHGGNTLDEDSNWSNNSLIAITGTISKDDIGSIEDLSLEEYRATITLRVVADEGTGGAT